MVIKLVQFIFPIISITVIAITRFIYAGVVSPFWYVLISILSVLYIAVFPSSSHPRWTKPLTSIFAFTIIASLTIMLFKLPTYTYNEAVANVRTTYAAEQFNDIGHSKRYWKLVWDYSDCAVSHPNYLILTNSSTAVSFDPFSGHSHMFNIFEKFPFLFN